MICPKGMMMGANGVCKKRHRKKTTWKKLPTFRGGGTGGVQHGGSKHRKLEKAPSTGDGNRDVCHDQCVETYGCAGGSSMGGCMCACCTYIQYGPPEDEWGFDWNWSGGQCDCQSCSYMINDCYMNCHWSDHPGGHPSGPGINMHFDPGSFGGSSYNWGGKGAGRRVGGKIITPRQKIRKRRRR